MKRIRIAICDDDSIGRGLLQESLEYLLQENNLQADISSYCSGQELLREQNRYDILFLDIRMPKINGIRTAEKYREWYEDTIIIFLTSYEDYVFEGYKVNAFRYLKKPMEQEKLWEALLSAVSKLEKEYEIELWDEEGLHIVRPKDIIYVETSGRNVIVRTVEEDYYVKMGITQFAENLNGTDFISPHQSYYVNMRYIKEFNKQEAILTNGEKVKISCKKYAQFRDIYCEYRRNRRNH
ncbi:MAG: LytR/AlgR family response regulator transcription factor [Lachnospiraceae bacterium]